MNKPLYILSAIPTGVSKLKNLFDFGEKSIKELLENPGQLRPMGWDLNTHDTARIVNGEYLEIRNGERKLIHLHEDGTLILFAAANETFLAWGPRERPFYEDARLNVLAIIELTYNFVDFYKKLIPHFLTKSRKISFRVKLKNAFLDSQHKLYIVPHEASTIQSDFPFEKFQAQQSEIEEILFIDLEYLLKSPQYLAYDLIRKLYLCFNIPENKIPYTGQDEEGKRFIDIEKIKSIK